jgi:hypothetical protein
MMLPAQARRNERGDDDQQEEHQRSADMWLSAAQHCAFTLQVTHLGFIDAAISQQLQDRRHLLGSIRQYPLCLGTH